LIKWHFVTPPIRLSPPPEKFNRPGGIPRPKSKLKGKKMENQKIEINEPETLENRPADPVTLKKV